MDDFIRIDPGTKAFNNVEGIREASVRSENAKFYDQLVYELKTMKPGQIILVPRGDRDLGNVVKTLAKRGFIRDRDYSLGLANRQPDGSRYPQGQKPWKLARRWRGSPWPASDEHLKMNPNVKLPLPPLPPRRKGQVSMLKALDIIQRTGRL